MTNKEKIAFDKACDMFDKYCEALAHMASFNVISNYRAASEGYLMKAGLSRDFLFKDHPRIDSANA